MNMVMNSKNFVGWLQLAINVFDLPDYQVNAIKRYINRTDYARRQKELDDIFGGEEWLILQCARERTVQEG